MKKEKAIYFDHSATTPVDADVLKAMLPYFSENYGNPSSVHQFGQRAMAGVDQARTEAANFLNCATDEVVFTSGATEANNLALKGVIAALRKKEPGKKLHIITSVVEHDSVLEPIAELERSGVEVTHVPVDKNGVVNLKKIEASIKENTALVSIMYVNSEVGSIQPIKAIGKSISKINDRRLKDWNNLKPELRAEKPRPIYFHTDATQAANFFSCNTQALYVDLLSLSAHKIYGPKGVGLLYVNKRVALLAQQLGGHHENNRRSGTINSAGIVGLGRALRNLTPENQEKHSRKIYKLRDLLAEGLLKNIPGAILNTDRQNATPAHAHFSFPGVEGETTLIALDLEGIAVSTGSACASNSLKASHVLIAMGIKVEVAHTSIRFTLGKHSAPADVKKLITVLPPIIKRFRDMSPLK
ncbi:cysteine desulfurase [Candidatus Falkowbacteria bacterium]|nr:cysteine desulfurase [Candidatus Falkowbacteria bacterium]